MKNKGELKAAYKGFSLAVGQFGPGLGFAVLSVPFAAVAMSRGISVQNPPGSGVYSSDAGHSPIPTKSPEQARAGTPTPVQFSFKDKVSCPATLHPNEQVPSNCGNYVSSELSVQLSSAKDEVILEKPSPASENTRKKLESLLQSSQ